MFIPTNNDEFTLRRLVALLVIYGGLLSLFFFA